MNFLALLSFKFLLSFFIGAIPFAVISLWGTGIDITKVGSRNPGFNNVLRVSTRLRAAFVLLGDLTKGGLAVFLLSTGTEPPWILWGLALTAVAGHCWTPFLGFKGGKGVATMVGAFLYLQFFITLVWLPLYPILRFFGRKMSWGEEGAISSMITMTFVAVTIFIVRGPSIGFFALIALFVVVLRHSSNIRKLFS